MIDMNKKYRTRDGREVRIYATDAGGVYPVHGAVELADGHWAMVCWSDVGNAASMMNRPHMHDLIEVKPECWCSVHQHTIGYFQMSGRTFETEAEALADRAPEGWRTVGAWKAPE